MKQFSPYLKYERNAIIFLLILIVLLIFFKAKTLHLLIQNSDKTELKSENKYAQLIEEIESADKEYYANKYSKSNNSSYQTKSYNKSYSNNTKSAYNNSYKAAKSIKVDINKANEEQFKVLYGIGETYAARIVKFREKLGGFYSINQIKEVYGISDSLYQSIQSNLIISNANNVKKINICTATVEDFKAHPYISSKLAYQFVNYRTKVKMYTSIEDAKVLYAMDDDLFQKLSPYLKVNE